MATENTVINNGLTMYARGYRNQHLIASDIFPSVRAPTLSGKFYDFGFDDFTPESDGPHELDAPYQELEYQIELGNFSIGNYGNVIRASDLELDNADSELQLGMRKVRRVIRKLDLQKEVRAKDIAYKAASFVAKNKPDQAAKKWDARAADGSSVNDPRIAVFDAKDIIRQQIGQYGNALMIPADVYKALATNSFMREGFVNVREGPLTKQSIALQFDMDPEMIYVGGSIQNTANKAKTRAMSDIWSQHVLVFAKDMMVGDMEMPEDSSFGATFLFRGYERARVYEGPSGNPPGNMYVVQMPYGQHALQYLSAVLLQNCV